jgi:hypothetical protein
MRLTQPDYIKLVKAAYYKKRANTELSPLLAQSTPANIRRECVHVYQERYDNRDEKTLRAFFGPGEHGKQFLQVIENFATDKFRPLDNYLKEETETTDDRNLELLAWLIDFQHRPFVFGMEVTLNEDERCIIGTSGNSSPEPISKQNNLHEGKQRVEDIITPLKSEENKVELTNNDQEKKRKRTIIIFFIVAVCLGGGYFIWQQQRSNQIVSGNLNNGCMYWIGDHYEAIPCNEERKDRLILPMDAEKMKNFKRILKEDTITEKSIGYVYYIRIDRRIEYYTTEGNHPIEITRPLRPLTSYMFEKHLLKKENMVKDSVTN